ncbi:hypothetical protein [Halorubrum sp. DTA46]|uniref:hypothetical protein n=1 Tax=Halorubrum sp. DTA46 TaxID=3402162 RepID=UPI003AAAA4BC
MVSDADGASDADGTSARPGDADEIETLSAGADSPLVARWLELDRGWQALALGLAVVAVHGAGQAAGLF